MASTRKRGTSTREQLQLTPPVEKKTRSGLRITKPKLVISHIFRNINDDEFKDILRTVSRNLKLCRGLHREHLETKVLPKADLLFVLEEVEKVGARTKRFFLGFAVITIKNITVTHSSGISQEVETWHIELICTEPGKGYGKMIMEAIEKLAAKHRIFALSLDAQPNVINFYRKFGFYNGNWPSLPASLPTSLPSASLPTSLLTEGKGEMPAPTPTLERKIHLCEEDKDITELASPLASKFFSTGEESVGDVDFARFLELLSERRYVANPTCEGISYTMEKGKPWGCSVDGYKMIKCLKQKTKK